MPYVAPFAAFMLFLVIVDSWFPNEHYLLYPAKSLLVAGVIVWFWKALPSLKPAAPLVSIAVGVLGVVLWVGLEGPTYRLDGWLAEGWNRAVALVGLTSWQMAADSVPPAGRDPFALYPAAEAWVLIAFRVAGIALVVPVMEELFWRGFLMRWLIREDFEAVPLGTYAALSFWATTACFASVHGAEWPQGLVVGVLYGAWFVRTKSLGSIMLAHGTTNLLLALYCLISGDWHFLSTVQVVQLPK
jgi:membrane protease YdiL (CAAX protease family)